MSVLASLFGFVVFIAGIIALPLVFMRIIYPGLLRKRPSFAAIAASFFVLLAFFITFFIFPSAFSIAMVSFAALMLLPFVVKLIETENRTPAVQDAAAPEHSEEQRAMQEKGFYVKPQRQWLYARSFREIFSRHEKLLLVYIFLFAGMALMYTMIFAVFSPEITDIAFENQLQLLQPRGAFVNVELFWQILANNLQLVFVAFALSIFYGSGSILILSYNASIAGVLYGASFRTLIYGTAPFASNIALFLPHTIIEILGYLLAAVAGGILIHGLYKENLRDSLVLFAFALAMIIAGAWVEVIVPFV